MRELSSLLSSLVPLPGSGPSANQASPTPVIVFNASRRVNDELKDSARNALDTGEFVVNVVTEPLAEMMDQTSESLSPEESEDEGSDRYDGFLSRRGSPSGLFDSCPWE